MDTCVGNGAGVQATCGSVLEESCAKLLAVSLGHGHVPCRRVDDVASAAGVVIPSVVSVVVTRWWSIGGWVAW